MSKNQLVVTIEFPTDKTGEQIIEQLFEILPGGYATIGGAHDRDDDLVCKLCGDDGEGDDCCPVETGRLREAGIL